MSYLPVGNYDIQALQHRSGKYNPLHSLFKMCGTDIYVIYADQKVYPTSGNENCTFSTIKWAKSYYYMIKLLVSVTQFGQIWKRLNEITLDCGANFTRVLGYKAFEVQDWMDMIGEGYVVFIQTLMDDSDIDVKSSSYGDHQLFVEVFLALAMSLC